MYGVAGERRLTELELPWLAGLRGLAAGPHRQRRLDQLQLDVYGEVVDALYQARAARARPSDGAWRLTRQVLDWLESGWREPDEGIWEVRGGRAGTSPTRR